MSVSPLSSKISISFRDIPRVVKAVATNVVAWAAPALYLRVTNQTGRGESNSESIADIANYFWMSFRDYFVNRGLEEASPEEFLAGKCLLEYGPGDFPGVAALMLAFGADRVYCVDRFPMVRMSQKNCEVFRALTGRLNADQLARLNNSMVDVNRPELGFKPDHLKYIVTPDGCSGLREEVDFIYSRAVLEHVNDLPATFQDMRNALKKDGVAIHLVDLRSHGLHRHHPLDFLVWPAWLWRVMYSEKGVPNRHRLGVYRSAATAAGLTVPELTVTHELNLDEVDSAVTSLAAPFRSLGARELACLGFWICLRKC